MEGQGRKKRAGGGEGEKVGGEGEGEGMWRGPESGLPRGPHWLSVGLLGSI